VKGDVEFWTGSDALEFADTGGIVTDGGIVDEFNEALGVSTAMVMLPVGVGDGRIVDKSPVEKKGTVDQLMETNDSLEMLPEGVGNAAVVLSNGRVVGGISVTTVTLPVGTDTVTFVVAVTTNVEADSTENGGSADDGVISGTCTVEFTTGIPTVTEPVPTGTVTVIVVFTGTELVVTGREKLPERSASDSGMEEVVFPVGAAVELGGAVTGKVELTGGISTVVVKPVERGTVSTKVVLALGVSMATVMLVEGVMTPLAPVELAVAERLNSPVRSPSLGLNGVPAEVVGTGGITPESPAEVEKPVTKESVKLPDPPREILADGVGSVLAGGMTPSVPMLFVTAVAPLIVKFAVATAVVMTSVRTVGVTTPFPPVERTTEALPATVVFVMTTTTVSEESAVTTVGVSTPPAPVEVLV
jgi:hypothetical protein